MEFAFIDVAVLVAAGLIVQLTMYIINGRRNRKDKDDR